jgi:hypothetical protein
MNRLFLLVFAICFAVPAMAMDYHYTFECKRVRSSEMIRALRSLTAVGVSFKEEDGKVIATGCDPALYKRMKEVMEVIDAPPSGVPVRFIKLRFADVTHVAGVISQAFPAGEGNDELPLQAVPNLRTNEVFLMGDVKDIHAAEALVLLLDQAQTPGRRGCGELGA